MIKFLLKSDKLSKRRYRHHALSLFSLFLLGIALLLCLTGFGAFAQNVTLDAAIMTTAMTGETRPSV